MEPHVKIIRLYELETVKQKVKFISKHIEDVMFVQLLLLSISPEFRYVVKRELSTEITAMPTAPTKSTFGKLRYILYRLDTYSSDIEDELIDYLNTLDSPTKVAYSIIVKRLLGITIADVYKTLNEYTKTTINNEFPVTFGFPSFPCYVQIVPKDVIRINIIYTVGSPLVVTLDGRRLEITGDTYKDLCKLPIDTNNWLTGYFVNNVIYISDYYLVNSIFSERIKAIDRLLEIHKLDNVKVIPPVLCEKLVDIQTVAETLQDSTSILSKQDTLPEFKASTNNQILIDTNFL